MFAGGEGDGTTLLSTPVIESIFTSAAQVVRKAQSMGDVSASPFECLSAVLLRDEVVATIKECVCVCYQACFLLHLATAFSHGAYCVSQVASGPGKWAHEW